MEEMRKRENQIEPEKHQPQQRPSSSVHGGEARFHDGSPIYDDNDDENGKHDDSRAPPPSSKKQRRHDPETSKALVWGEQADEDKLLQNQALRKKYYHETKNGGIGIMDPEELERAKLLIARDERKKQKKQMKKLGKKSGAKGAGEEEKEEEGKDDENERKKKGHHEDNHGSSEDGMGTKKASEEVCTKELKGKKPCKEDHDAKSKQHAKAKRDRNRALRTRFQETAGKGMSKEDVRRAKQLLERDERKKQKRAAALEEQ